MAQEQQQSSGFSLTTFFIKIIVAIALLYATAWMVDNLMQGRESMHELTLKVRADAFEFLSKIYEETH